MKAFARLRAIEGSVDPHTCWVRVSVTFVIGRDQEKEWTAQVEIAPPDEPRGHLDISGKIWEVIKTVKKDVRDAGFHIPSKEIQEFHRRMSKGIRVTLHDQNEHIESKIRDALAVEMAPLLF